ncbi:MAG: GNAT family N-acetyltransferase [Rhodospirillaceae bacterium]
MAAGLLSVTITYLEMCAAPVVDPGPPPFSDIAVRAVTRPSVRGYRFLYDGVGEPWLWHERRRLSDEALARIIEDPRIEILVLTRAGRVAGYAELDHRKAPDIKLAYFGLFPDFIGCGLGRWLLGVAVRRAQAQHPRRLLVNTCSFDHPAALPLYLSAGFTEYDRVERRISDPRLEGILPLTAAPHVAPGGGV